MKKTKSGNRFFAVTLLCIVFFGLVPVARAQYVSVSGGGLFPQGLSAAPAAGTIGGSASADFSKSSIVAVDAGIGLLPFLGAGVHYSYSKPELTLRRGDAFGSSARVDFGAHTLTLDARLHSPRIMGFRGYGFAGAGFTRFAVNIKSQVEIPFPKGAPGNITSPVITFGGGVEKKFFPLLAVKLEVRDYVTPISSSFYQPGGAWHRVVVLVGIVAGR